MPAPKVREKGQVYVNLSHRKIHAGGESVVFLCVPSAGLTLQPSNGRPLAARWPLGLPLTQLPEAVLLS